MRKYVERCSNTCIVRLEKKRTSKNLCPIEPEVSAPRSLIFVDVLMPCESSLLTWFARPWKLGGSIDMAFPGCCWRQGRNEDGKSVSELWENLGIENRHSSAYQAQGEGQAERTFENTKQSLCCLLDELGAGKSHWPTISSQRLAQDGM